MSISEFYIKWQQFVSLSYALRAGANDNLAGELDSFERTTLEENKRVLDAVIGIIEKGC